MALNLICDGNWAAHMDFGAIAKGGKDPLSSLSAQTQLAKGMAARIFSVAETLPVSNIIICVDSKSWRKEFFPGYKSKRATAKGAMDDETKKLFYNVIEDFCNAAKNKGVIISRVPGAEGDDLLWAWSRHLNNKGENCLIMSGDRDTVQLVYDGKLGNEPEKGWTVVWTNSWKNQTFFVPKGWKGVQEDVFDMSASNDVTSVTSLSKDLFATVTEMPDPSSIVFSKILLGDDGDDVPAVWVDGKKRLTPSKAQIVLEYVQKKGYTLNDWPKLRSNEPLLLDLCGTILRTMSAIDGTNERAAVLENLYRNEKLVYLDSSSLPPNLLRSIDRHMEESPLEAEHLRNPSLWKRNGILKGSRFEHVDAAPRTMDPFAFVDLPI